MTVVSVGSISAFDISSDSEITQAVRKLRVLGVNLVVTEERCKEWNKPFRPKWYSKYTVLKPVGPDEYQVIVLNSFTKETVLAFLKGVLSGLEVSDAQR